MPLPVIGITVDTHRDGDRYESPCYYASAIEAAGGLPILLPYKSSEQNGRAYADMIDGLLLTGGNDLDPSVFNEARHSNAVPIDPLRQRFELALLAEIENRRLPVLGICLGCQVMNVHRGGSLHQFLPELPRQPMIEHRKLGSVAPRHDVSVQLDSRIGRAIGRGMISVNSSHNQAVNRLGKALRVVATSFDGVIEAFEDSDYPLFAAVQWHPERLADEAPSRALFKLLVEEAIACSPENRRDI